MPRIMQEVPALMGVIVNRLDQQLERHVEYRMRHYSMYAFFMYALASKLAKENENDLKTDLRRFVVRKATHQIGSGLRRSAEEYSEFIRSADVLEISTADFKNIDAAHTCGLGASPQLDVMVQQSKDKHASRLHNGLLAAMRHTAYMPQIVNVGTDKVIDKVHADNILEHLAAVSPANPLLGVGALQNYVRRAELAMRTYREAKVRQGRLGLAACAEVYLEFYNSAARVDRAIIDIHHAYYEECRDYEIETRIILG